MNTQVLPRLLIFGGGITAMTFSAIMILVYGIAFTTIVPSDTLKQATPQPTEQKMRYIVYVEDKTEVARNILLSLTGEFSGATVSTYPSVELLLADPIFADPTIYPSVIILDGNIGQTLGWSYIPRLRARWPKANIIGFSATPGADDLFRKAGTDGFVPKDAPSADLMNMIKTFLK